LQGFIFYFNDYYNIKVRKVYSQESADDKTGSYGGGEFNLSIIRYLISRMLITVSAIDWKTLLSANYPPI